ncbi:MAG: hypothetical protein AAGD96_14425 [Chloroflexota bacterium]
MGVSVVNQPNIMGRQSQPPPKQIREADLHVRRQVQRTVIIEKAMQVLNQQSTPRPVSVEFILRELNVPEFIFLKLFDSADEFKNELVRTGWKDLLRPLRQIVTRGPGREGLDEVISHYRQFVRENKGTYFAAACEGRNTRTGQKYTSKLIHLLHVVLASCDLGKIDLNVAAKNMADVIHGLAVVELSGGKKHNPDLMITHMLKVYLNEIFHK